MDLMGKWQSDIGLHYRDVDREWTRLTKILPHVQQKARHISEPHDIQLQERGELHCFALDYSLKRYHDMQ